MEILSKVFKGGLNVNPLCIAVLQWSVAGAYRKKMPSCLLWLSRLVFNRAAYDELFPKHSEAHFVKRIVTIMFTFIDKVNFRWYSLCLWPVTWSLTCRFSYAFDLLIPKKTWPNNSPWKHACAWKLLPLWKHTCPGRKGRETMEGPFSSRQILPLSVSRGRRVVMAAGVWRYHRSNTE